jgi:tartrate dehydratase beta subunit/fumarate hydratase class I family protein
MQFMAQIKKLQAPLSDADVRSLNAGDEVLISGVVYTARDMAHKRLCEAIEAQRDSLKKHTAVHLSTLGGAGALLSGHITASEIIAYEDLGTEAVRKLRVVDFPAIVAYDCYGNSVYKTERALK